ncbi:hypothetical protein SCATT_13820 [Streptantibioticus cattleyicolor NRRL 8057 = DSM 46488]|uniref:Uncharacterized protein n=1 Tax=Streptantibioticus cattleyicolor (strain ATCC 35852 / DSM 46488 / JCM 4925 / NBRC 14057 / NRRL 8057) TaxID=1003195 RepID=F8K253_STREN|nr:hypothetical protein SCATT_13820 [Streptantibioticus cattleyicolor NRRL 8057 = DSM 46488]CCB74101.1 protein of unknown function [Streptantibioticus cattleyicolor NRRL 8057 = DSM 46488]
MTPTLLHRYRKVFAIAPEELRGTLSMMVDLATVVELKTSTDLPRGQVAHEASLLPR